MGEGMGTSVMRQPSKPAGPNAYNPVIHENGPHPPVLEVLSNQCLFLNIPKNKGFGEVT